MRPPLSSIETVHPPTLYQNVPRETTMEATTLSPVAMPSHDGWPAPEQLSPKRSPSSPTGNGAADGNPVDNPVGNPVGNPAGGSAGVRAEAWVPEWLPDTASDTEHLFPSDEHENFSSRPMPLHKRRRVTRACDECRRKKIKCCGKQPCTHCSVYSYECTYDKPSNRRRNPAPQYVEALENRLQRAETLLRKFMPDVDLSDPTLEPDVQQEFLSRERMRARQAQAARLRQRDEQLEKLQQQQQQQQIQLQLQEKQLPLQTQSRAHTVGQAVCAEDEQILSMIETIGHLKLEGGEFDFRGVSSNAVFLSKMKEHFHDLLGSDSLISFFSRAPPAPAVFHLDTPPGPASPWSASSPPASNLSALPPKAHAQMLCYLALNSATCLLRIVHIPSFYETFDSLYDKAPGETLTPEDHRSLGLLYAVMALGSMCNFSPSDSTRPTNYQAAMDEGLKYYAAARQLLQNIADCRDLPSLQALVFMILFLQSTSNVSGCYPIIGIALRVALRMGLHRHLPHVQMTPIEHETRRRVFYVIRQIDIYVSALLGFPMFLLDEDIDQLLPTEVDDAYITKDGYRTPPAGTPSFFQACNAYTKLMRILVKVVKYIYPLKGVDECVVNRERPNATKYRISNAHIREVECDLRAWQEELPSYWRPSAEGPLEVIRVRTLLRFAYAHVQMMLYRPFLHYISPRYASGKTVQDRYYACAAAGISVSRNIVHIGMELQRQAVTIGSHWFVLYTMFFAMLSLVYYALENPDKPGSSEIMDDALVGKALIASIAKKSMTADKIAATLNSLFDRLPERLTKRISHPQPPTRKRSAPGLRTAAEHTTQAPPLPAPLARQPAEDSHSDIIQDQKPQLPTLQPHTSFDTSQELLRQQQQQQIQQDQASSSSVHGLPELPPVFLNMHDLLPLNMPAVTGSPESSGTPSTLHRSAASFPPAAQQHLAGDSAAPPPADAATMETTDSLYTLGEMLFPSSDPFAYPSQPLVDFGLQHLTSTGDGCSSGGSSANAPMAAAVGGGGGGGQASSTGAAAADGAATAATAAEDGSSGLVYGPTTAAATATSALQDDLQHIEAMRFYAPQGFGDMEGQLLGPMPAYLVQTSTDGRDEAPDHLASGLYHAGSLPSALPVLVPEPDAAPPLGEEGEQQQQPVADEALSQAQRDQAKFEDLFGDVVFMT